LIEQIVCYTNRFNLKIEYRKRKRKNGTEYYGNIIEKGKRDFSYIRSKNGKEIFFYPFDLAEKIKDDLIKCDFKK
jgi:hypothetical protein